MFTKEQIQSAYRRVKSGADFPKLVQELKSLGVLWYDHFVADGSNVFHGTNGYTVTIMHQQTPIFISEVSSADQLKHSLKIHQAGQTDYPTFCLEAGEAGVEKWTSDLSDMTVTYIDLVGRELVVEAIPSIVS